MKKTASEGIKAGKQGKHARYAILDQTKVQTKLSYDEMSQAISMDVFSRPFFRRCDEI